MADAQSTVVVPASARSTRNNASARLDALDFVMEFVGKAGQVKDRFRPVWDEISDNFMVVPYNDFRDRLFPLNTGTAVHLQRQNGRGNFARLKDPETHQIITDLTDSALELLFPQNADYLMAQPIGRDDPEKARYINRVVRGGLSQPGQFEIHHTIFQNAFTFGTSIVEIGWESRTRNQLVKVPVLDESGQPTGSFELVPDEIMYRDAPLIREVDLYNFYPDPSGTRIHKNMMGVAKRFDISAADAISLGHGGTYELDRVHEAVSRTPQDAKKGYPSGESRVDPADRRFRDIPTQTADGFHMMTGFEYWGRVPYRPSDGYTNRVITVINGVVVRDHINPYIDGAIPFKEIVVNPVGGRFYGLSPAEVVRYLQDSADNMLMTLNDAADLAVRGPLLMGAGFSGDPNRLKERRLMDVIPCSNVDQVKPIPVDLSALGFAAVELLRRKQSMRDATGSGQVVEEVAKSDRAAATSVSEVSRIASRKVKGMVRLIERDAYPWIGRTYHSRLRQFADEEIVSSLAGEVFTTRLEDIDIDADIRFVGSDQAISKFQKAAALREALAVIGANPQAVATLPKLVIRYLRDGLDIPDAEDIVAEALARLTMQSAKAGADQGAENAQAATGASDSSFGTETGQTEMESHLHDVKSCSWMDNRPVEAVNG